MFKNKFNKNKIKFIFNLILLFIINQLIIKKILYKSNILYNEKKEINQNINGTLGNDYFYSKEYSFKKAIHFIENNLKGVLLNNPPTKYFDNPISSVVIPVYNSKNYISRTIRSIQNQNIINFEIILVDDCSIDDTLSFLEELQLEDQRIKIIRNQKNMGIFYTRCIGTLSAKGKYIFPLDNDDMFLDEDIFQVISNISEEGNFDIVEFKGIRYELNKDLNFFENKIYDIGYTNRPLNLILYQPELGKYQIQTGNTLDKIKIYNVFLWCKSIRTQIYQKAINKLGIERYSRHIIRHEDIIMNYALFNTARSYKFVGKYGILNEDRNNSASKKSTNIEMNIYYIYLLDVSINFTLNRFENRKLLVHLLMYILKRKSIQNTLKYNYKIKKLFYSCINQILNMTNIETNHKIYIKNKIRWIGLKF